MAEKKSSIHGLSIVDVTTNDSSLKEEGKGAVVKDEELVVKIEDEASVDEQHDNRRDELVREDSFFEEAEEKLNLFDVLDQKDEVEKENKVSLQNSTLIITTEEHLDTTTCDDTLNTTTETLKNEPIKVEPLEETKKKPKSKTEEQGHFWVSNISRHVKATNLKKFFSPLGKVLTAKVLTNGKNYFGYVSVDSIDTAGKCIRLLNNTLFEGKKVIVSKERPDLRDTKSMVRMEPKRKKPQKLEVKENKSTETKVTVEEKSKISKSTERDLKTKTSNEEELAELNKKLEKSKADANRYRYKVTEYQRRHDGMRKKCDNLEKELKDIQYQMRAERRRVNQDKEQFEKTKKLELIRLEADKALINKELAEVKKLREHLKMKIDEINAQAKSNPKRRDVRSPLPTRTPPRVRSPVMRIGSRVTYRSDDRVEKKRKRDEPLHGRTPPPPKLTNGVAKKRGDNLPHRQFFDEFEKRSSPMDRGHGFDYRHKPSFPPSQELPRTPWPPSYPKDPRRVNAPPSSTQSYPSEPRYGGGYQFPQSSVTVPPRSYYPEFGKPYGHY